MAAPFDGVYFGSLFIRGLGRTWVEKYPMKATGTGTSLAATFREFVFFRRLILAADYKVIWARVTLGDSARQRWRSQNGEASGINLASEAGPPVVLEKSNDRVGPLHVAFETANGHWVNRLFGGIRDSWVLGGDLVFDPTVPGGAVVDGVDNVAGLTREVAMGNFLAAVMQYSDRCVKDSTTGGLVRENFTQYTIRGVTARKRGSSAFGGKGRKKVNVLP